MDHSFQGACGGKNHMGSCERPRPNAREIELCWGLIMAAATCSKLSAKPQVPFQVPSQEVKGAACVWLQGQTTGPQPSLALEAAAEKGRV